MKETSNIPPDDFFSSVYNSSEEQEENNFNSPEAKPENIFSPINKKKPKKLFSILQFPNFHKRLNKKFFSIFKSIITTFSKSINSNKFHSLHRTFNTFITQS